MAPEGPRMDSRARLGPCPCIDLSFCFSCLRMDSGAFFAFALGAGCLLRLAVVRFGLETEMGRIWILRPYFSNRDL